MLRRSTSAGTPEANGVNAFDSADARYVLVGYRLGNWLPRYTFAQENSNLGIQPTGAITSHTFGVNYTISPKTIMKVEYEYDQISAPGVGALTNYFQPTGSTATHASAVYAALDFAF